jgi:hypothetical protein
LHIWLAETLERKTLAHVHCKKITHIARSKKKKYSEVNIVKVYLKYEQYL